MKRWISALRLPMLATALALPTVGAGAQTENVEGYLDACFAIAEADYQVPSCILRGIHQVETSGSTRTGIVSVNKDGSRDYGIMQHNDFWVRFFNKNFGITGSQLSNDRCLSIRGAGYVVRYEINRAGDFWKGVARYHNPDPVIGYQYAVRVARQAQRYGCQIK